MSNIVELGKAKHPRRFYGECQRCQRTDYLPWATEHGERYCGWCHEKDALEYLASRGKIFWECGARKQGTAGGNDPADCNWPICGCDPFADKVIAALDEMGMLTPLVSSKER